MHCINISIGEVLLYTEYREKGFVRKFYEIHEKIAHERKFKYLVGITVERAEDHPYRPINYQSPDQIWQHFGLQKIPGLFVQMSWNEVDTNKNTENILAIWQKKLL